MKSLKLALALFFMLLPVTVNAADYYVDITNKTGYTIFFIYVSPDNSDSWEEDILGSEVLMDSMTRRVTLTGYASPVFDIRLVDEDGDTYTFMKVNVSNKDIIATLADIDT